MVPERGDWGVKLLTGSGCGKYYQVAHYFV